MSLGENHGASGYGFQPRTPNRDIVSILCIPEPFPGNHSDSDDCDRHTGRHLNTGLGEAVRKQQLDDNNDRNTMRRARMTGGEGAWDDEAEDWKLQTSNTQ